MTDKEKAFLEMLYHRVLALENLLIVKGWTTVTELNEHNQSIDQYFKEQANAKEVSAENGKRGYQSPVHPPKKPTRKVRRRRI